MKIDNEERLKIISAYMPCIAAYNDKYCKGEYAIQGVSISEGMALFESDDDSDWWNVDEICQLLLKDLSQISDEDARYFIETKNTLPDSVGINIESVVCKNGVIAIEWSALNYLRQEDGMVVKYMPIWYADYLRGKGYNCGYGKHSAQDLIDLGIVIIK